MVRAVFEPAQSPMSDRPVPQPGILKIAPYVPGKSQAAPGVVAIKLSANESPLGASPAALAALAEADRSPEIYPEGTSRILREALGEVHGLDPERIVCGNGSDDLLHLLAQCYLGEGDEAVMSRHGFNVYPIITMGASAEIVMAPERDYRADVDALLGAVTPRTKMVFLANPNNPTGTYLGGAELERLHAGLRPDILLDRRQRLCRVCDGGRLRCRHRAGERQRECRHGADVLEDGARGVADRLDVCAGACGRCGQPHPRTVQRQPAGAVRRARRRRATSTSLRGCAHYNAQWRDWLTRALNGNAIRVVPSEGNFILALFDDAATSKAAFQALFDEGLIVREIGVYGIENGLRISIGPEPAMRRLVEVLKAFGAPGAKE